MNRFFASRFEALEEIAPAAQSLLDQHRQKYRAWSSSDHLPPEEREDGDASRSLARCCGFLNLTACEKFGIFFSMSVTLEMDEEMLAALPLGPGERERHMQIELACRYYANGWLTLAQAARLAGLDHFSMGVALGERGIPRNYGLTEALEDMAHARR